MPQIMGGGSMNITVPQSCLRFEGSGTAQCAYVSFTGNPKLKVNGKDKELTISAWCKVTGGYTDQSNTIAVAGCSTYGYSILIWKEGLGATTGRVSFYVGGTSSKYDAESNEALSKEVWHHICGVHRYDTAPSGNTYLFIDGEYIASAQVPMGPNLTNSVEFCVGALQNTHKRVFSGQITDVKFWSGTALTNDQVRQLYNGCNTVTPTAEWKFTDREGTTVTETYNDLDLTIDGATWMEREIPCWCKRWDEGNWDVTIETFLEAPDRNFIMNQVTPGAYRELYNILGTPRYIDTTYSSGNTLILEPRSGFGINDLRQTRTIAVKNISDTFENWETFGLKIEGVRIDAGL